MNEPRPDDPEALLAQSNWLRRLARGLVRDPSAAEDVVQDTWVAALRERPADLRAWMSVVARNFARRSRRDAGLRSAHEPRGARTERIEGPDEIAARVELQRKLAEALLALEEPYRSALVLRYLDGHSSIQVAERLGVSHDAARQRIARGLAKLREKLDREHKGGRAGWMGALLPFAQAPKATIAGGLLLMGTKTKIVAALAVAALGLWLWKGPLAPDPLEPDPSLQPAPVVAASPDGLPSASKPLDSGANDSRAPIAAPAQAAPAEPAESAHALRGLVLDPKGVPVAGARVLATCSVAYDYQTLDLALAARAERAGETRSDAEGRFELPLDPARAYMLAVQKDGFAQATFGKRHTGETITVRLLYGAALEGHVTQGEQHLPLANARVRCFLRGNDSPDGARFEVATETDERGLYHLDALPPSILFLEVLAAGLPCSKWTEVHPEAGKTITQDVHLQAKAWIKGIVLDSLTRAPIAGAEVSTIWVMRNPVVSDASGHFELPVDTGYWKEFYVRATGYGFRGIPLGEATRETGAADVQIVLEPARSVRGRVLDPRGAGVKGAYIAACASEFGETQRHDWVPGLTDADGRFEIADLRPDMQHSLFVRAQGFGSVVYELPPAERVEARIELADIVLQPAGLITGSVVDENDRPVPELQVVLRGMNSDRGRWDPRGGKSLDTYIGEREGRTDDRGAFTFDELAAGSYVVELRRDSHQVSGSDAVELEQGQRRTGVKLVLPNGLTLSGRVRDHAGNPVRQVNVSIEPTLEGLSDCDVRTDDDGRFQARGIAPGAYRIQLWPARPDTEHPELPFYVHTQFENQQANGRELELVIEDGVWLAGVVVEADGTPVAGAMVNAKEAGQEWGMTGMSDAQGKFRIGVERDKAFALDAMRSLAGATPGERRAYETDEARWGRVSQASGGAAEVRIVMPAK